MSFLKLSKIFLGVSVALVTGSLILLIVPGPVLSIEFTGGTLVEIKLPAGSGKEELRAALRTYRDDTAELQSASITETKAGTVFVRTKPITNEQHIALLDHLRTTLNPPNSPDERLQELQFTTIGPTVGESLKARSFWALLIASVAIVLYIALAFRTVPKRLSPMRFGVIAVIALIHDVMITIGIFTILSHWTTFQVDTLFVTALLSIMGYSVNDTIVIFDRIRDNLFRESNVRDFAQLAVTSLRQTLTRTINTGFGALIMLTVLFVLGSESIRWFILALIVGTIIGTYSSFFIATPLLIFWKKRA